MSKSGVVECKSITLPRVADQYWTGGAKVGSKDICFPMAELEVTGMELILRLADCSKYVFKPSQVNKIEFGPCASPGMLPAVGIRIRHQIPDYPEEIVFVFFCENHRPFLKKLRKLGYGTNPFWRGLLQFLRFGGQSTANC